MGEAWEVAVSPAKHPQASRPQPEPGTQAASSRMDLHTDVHPLHATQMLPGWYGGRITIPLASGGTSLLVRQQSGASSDIGAHQPLGQPLLPLSCRGDTYMASSGAPFLPPLSLALKERGCWLGNISRQLTCRWVPAKNRRWPPLLQPVLQRQAGAAGIELRVAER